jgi:hypothetical protein
MDKSQLRAERDAAVQDFKERGGMVTMAPPATPPGHRALQRAYKPKLKTGRPREEGERYPSGKLKPSKIKPSIEPIAPALWDRLRTSAIAAVEDARFGSQIGRLSLHGELSATQASAAFRIAQIYGRFERYRDLRRSVGSPSYMVASSDIADDNNEIEAITPEMLARSMAEELLEPEQLADLEQRVDAADKRFLKLQGFMRVFPSRLRAAIEELCVEDRPPNPSVIEHIGAALDETAKFFRIKAAPKDKDKKPPKREIVVTRDGAEHEIADPDRAAWMKALRTLRPDLSDPELVKVYATACALKAREVVERAKTAAKGKIVSAPSAGVSVIDQVARHAGNLMQKRTYKMSMRLNNDDEALTT